MKLFDMKKFQQNVSRELKRAYPDRRKLEMQCITAIAFVKNDMELLNCPCWVMIVNIVAMDMLKVSQPSSSSFLVYLVLPSFFFATPSLDSYLAEPSFT